jgi:flagellar biosynthesis anti-sigma factor FlgM
MKITRRPPTGLPSVGPGTTPAVGDAPEPEASEPGRRSDRVELSPEARLRAQLRREIGDVEAVPTDKVEALRAEVASGTYHRDPQVVAERLLRELATDLVA